jgi:hypothetical protein
MNAHFNAGVAAALVLGGILALLLATALALDGYGSPTLSRRTAPHAPAAASSSPEAEVDYIPETIESAPATDQR